MWVAVRRPNSRRRRSRLAARWDRIAGRLHPVGVLRCSRLICRCTDASPHGVPNLCSAQIRRPDPNATPWVLIPTRPSLLGKGEAVRVFAVAPGGREVLRVTLFTRRVGSETWDTHAMGLVGRRTFVRELGPPQSLSPLLDYYVEAEFAVPEGRVRSTAPPEAPGRFYTVTLM
jgi:hypothetical protein